MKYRFIGLVCGLASLLIGGCATIVAGPSWLSVETNPSNITVKVEKLNVGVVENKISPFKMELDKKSDYSLVIESPNYKSEQILISRKPSGWFWGNILIGGIIGMGIDYATGGMWTHNQHVVSVDLTSLSSAPDVIQLNIPVVIQYPDTSYETRFLPIMFRKKVAMRVKQTDQG